MYSQVAEYFRTIAIDAKRYAAGSIHIRVLRCTNEKPTKVVHWYMVLASAGESRPGLDGYASIPDSEWLARPSTFDMPCRCMNSAAREPTSETNFQDARRASGSRPTSKEKS